MLTTLYIATLSVASYLRYYRQEKKMQKETIELDEAEAHFKELVRRVVAGLHVILSKDQKPIAHLLPVGGRVPGLHAGAIWTSDDFDAPLPEEFWSEGK